MGILINFIVGLFGLLAKVLAKAIKWLFKIGFGWWIVLIVWLDMSNKFPESILCIMKMPVLLQHIIIWPLFLGTPIALINRLISFIKKEKINLVTEPFKRLNEKISNNSVEKKGYVAKTNNFRMAAPVGTVLAKEKGKYVCIPDENIYHTTVCGGTGSGKTVCLMATALSFGGSMLILDGKDGGEIRRKSANYRARYFNSTIKWFNPEKEDTFTFNPYSAFEYINEPDTDIADMLAICMIEKSVSEKNPMWTDNARILLSGAILWAKAKGLSFNETMEQIQMRTASDLVSQIKSDYDKQPEVYKNAWLKVSFMHSEVKDLGNGKGQVVGMAQETLSGIESNLRSKLSCFTSPNVQNALREDSIFHEIRPTDLENGSCTIYFNVPLSKASDQWKPVSKIFLGLFFNYFSRRGEVMAERGEQGKKIIFMLDEMVSYGKIDNIETMVALLRSAYVSIILCYQTFSKVDEIYGEKVRRTLFDNMSANVVLNCNDPETQLYFARMSGKYDKKKKSKSSNYNMSVAGVGKGQGSGSSENYEEHYLFREDTFGHLMDEDKLIVFLPSGCKKLEKVKYYKDRAFEEKLKKLES